MPNDILRPFHSNDSTLANLLAHYEANRVIRGLVQLLPYNAGGLIDVVLTQTLARMREQRLRAFFDELSNSSEPLDPKLLESEDFLHCYFATARYALNSRRHEKIRMFAKLLKASLTDGGLRDIDEYEGFAGILDELTYKELGALAILDSFSERPREASENDLQWTSTFWPEFEARVTGEIDVPPDEVTDFMNRIARTGCYELFTTGYWHDEPNNKGKLTPTYRRLKTFIGDEAAVS